MEKLYKTLPVDFQPQQNTFKFYEIVFSSNFDSGNLINIIQVNENEVKDLN
jgi:hypothetical protein